MKNDMSNYLIRQFETAWKLTDFHIKTLSTKECLWRPTRKGLHVYQKSEGSWCADWPESEEYDIGPPSIAWLTWHIGFWWSMVHNHSFGDGTLLHQNVMWPGNAEDVREWIYQLQLEWRTVLNQVTIDDLQSIQRTKWPFQDRPFGDVIAWVNVELVKNAAEIGYARFLYAVSASQ